MARGAASPLRQRLATMAGVFRSAFANPALRAVVLAYAVVIAMEFGTWLILLIWAYAHGGATAGMAIALVQLVPCVVLAPILGTLADRRHQGRFLVLGYAAQTATVGAVAAAVGLGAPTGVVFALAPLTSMAFIMTRPTQSGLLPALVRTPEELTAARVMAGWSEGSATLAGPALAGAVVTASGTGAALGVMAGLGVLSLLLGIRVARTDGRPASGPEPADPGDAARPAGVLADTWSTLVATLGEPRIRVLLVLTTFFYVLTGALDLLYVVLAGSLLHLPAGGAGYLSAAFGTGWILAGLVTAFLVGRHPLFRTLTGSLLASVGALALIAAVPRVWPAVVLLVASGLAGAVFDTTGKTLLQRAAPADAVAGAFAVLESLLCLGLALGTVVTWVGVRAAGPQGALVAPGIVAVVLLAVLWRRLRQVDEAATVPQVEIRLLRALPIFAPLPAPALEAVARELEPVRAPAGTVVVAQGDPGDRYYAVADGELEVTQDGAVLSRVTRGAGFGEIALIRAIPRTATVTATTDVLLYSLDGDLFLETVTGNPSAVRAAGTVVDGHLARGSSRAPDGGTAGGEAPDEGTPDGGAAPPT